ncbi:MAG TPA: ABC transporter substrate-binding protein [Thermoleophilia bacterium]|nr:ABC transporter substrate-binding protein [Thermoleophilia bacterium]
MRIRTAAAALAVCLLAAACGGSTGAPAQSNGRTSLSIELDWYPNPDHVGLFTAIDRGYFARAGLTVTPLTPGSDTDAATLVAAGRVDLAISYEPELFYAQQQHVPVVGVAAMVPTALNSIIVRGGLGVTRPAQLRGMTIGEDGTSSTAAFVATVMARAGVPASGYHAVDVGFNLLPALLAHRVDAVAGVFQNVEGIELAARGVHPVVFPVDRYGVPGYDELVVMASASRLASDATYRRAVARFVTALTAATAWARSHPDAAIAVMRRNASSGYRTDLPQMVRATLRLLDTSSLAPAAWNRFGLWMYAHRLLKERPDGAALVAAP